MIHDVNLNDVQILSMSCIQSERVLLPPAPQGSNGFPGSLGAAGEKGKKVRTRFKKITVVDIVSGNPELSR